MSESRVEWFEQPQERLLMDVLSEFTSTMRPDSSIQGILDHLVRRIIEILPIGAAGVTLLPRGGNNAYVAATSAAALEYEQLQQTLDEGPGVLACASGEPIAAPDLRGDERFPTFGPRASSAGLHAVFTFPLQRAGHLLGALNLYPEMAGPLSPSSITAAHTVAGVVATHLVTAQAREDPQGAVETPRQVSSRDELSELPDRALMLDRLELALRRIHRSGRSAAVICVDLGLLEPSDNPYPSRARREILLAAARRLRGAVRRTDTLAHLNDNMLAVLCEGLDTPDQAATIVARLADAMARPFHRGETWRAATSIGVAWIGNRHHQPGRTPEQLLRDAYLTRQPTERSLRSGDGSHRLVTKADLAGDLMLAQSRGEMHVEYQPVLATASNRIMGFEALLRWVHPDQGPIAPATFIPLAEESGLIDELGRWVLLQACVDRPRLQDEHPGAALSMAVNVSAHQLMSPGFAASVAAVLSATNFDPSLLILEITESLFIRDAERALAVLGELRALGVWLALDDFGTGYSSLSYLRRFPVQILKIDRSFIIDLVCDNASHSIVAAVVNLAHDLGMTVIAEGVETAEQRDEVSRLGCDAFQGFYFAGPSPAPGDQPRPTGPPAAAPPSARLPQQRRPTRDCTVAR